MLPQLICNDQGTRTQNMLLSGVAQYASGDYGANWATTAAIKTALGGLYESPIAGDFAILTNTNATGGGKRLAVYAGGKWQLLAANLTELT